MSFTSYSFIFIFLPLVIIIYHFLNGRKLYTAAKLVLLAASLGFYMSMGVREFIALMLLLCATYLIVYFAFRPERSAHFRKGMLIVGIVFNVCALLYCKYLLYFEYLLNKSIGSSFVYTAFVVPVGISYFTFSQIAFLVDSYRDDSVRYSFLDYALFVSFFPKITVGPIIFTGELIPQFNDPARKKCDYDKMSKGLYRFVLGLSKKLLIADNLGTFVDYGYTYASTLGSFNAALVILAYTLQIYFDFSGYCDMALAICQMLGFDIAENFNSPYRSLSIDEFWKTWHITLTRFFRNYLYFPLGGSRKGKIRTWINTLIIFLVSGLWHGAATTYVVWGLIHGIGLIISKSLSPFTAKLPKLLRRFVTFVFINITWVFFRSPDLSTAFIMLRQLFSMHFTLMDVSIITASVPVEASFAEQLILSLDPSLVLFLGYFFVILLIAAALILSLKKNNSGLMAEKLVFSGKRAALTVVLFVLSVLSLSQVTEFMYVNF